MCSGEKKKKKDDLTVSWRLVNDYELKAGSVSEEGVCVRVERPSYVLAVRRGGGCSVAPPIASGV